MAERRPMESRASLHPKTVTALSEGEVEPLTPIQRKVERTMRTFRWSKTVHPLAWATAVELAEGNARRLERIDEITIVVHNNEDWPDDEG